MAYHPRDHTDWGRSNHEYDRLGEPAGTAPLWVLGGIVVLFLVSLWAFGGEVEQSGDGGAGGTVDGVDIVPPAEIQEPAANSPVLD